MKLTKSQLKQIIKEETQKVLIEEEFKKYIRQNYPRLLAEGKSQEEIEELLLEGFKDVAKRLAMKYALPAMAIFTMLASGDLSQAHASELATAAREAPTMVDTGGGDVAEAEQKYEGQGFTEPFKIVPAGENFMLISCGKDSCSMLGKMSKANFAEKLASGEIQKI